jgi:hypothetical protein
MATAKLKRLRPGQLDCLVLDYVKAHRKEGPLTATSIAKGLGGRSAGAVANCLSRLAEDKKIHEVEKHPRRFVIKKAKSRSRQQ